MSSADHEIALASAVALIFRRQAAKRFSGQIFDTLFRLWRRNQLPNDLGAESEDVIQAEGTLGRLRRSEVIGTAAEFPTRRLAMRALSQRLGTINTGKARPQSVRTFGSFVKDDWTPVVLPTLKYATQKHYRYMLDVHLIPAFGQRQLRELTREELQSFLSRKLKGGLSWETVHHFKCGLSRLSVQPRNGVILPRTQLRKRNSHDDSMERSEWSLQSLLGHSSPEITREIYLHRIPEEQRRAVESVERLVFGPKWTQVQAPAQPASARVN